jgi:endonuclease YncB( thermonuclease family)
VSSVVAPDTLDVLIGDRPARVRLLGIAPPPPSGAARCFVPGALAATQQLVLQAGRQVRLERDVSDTDAEGRLLRYAWVVLPGGQALLQEALLADGAVQVALDAPDLRYQARFRAAEQRARVNYRGLWGDCPVTPDTP